MPPRLSTGSVASLTCAGTSFTAITSATTASGSVSRKTEPHQKCSSRIPEHSGPSAEIAPPIAAQSAIDFVRAAPRPERGDQRERRRVGHARGEPAEDPRDDQHFVRRRPRREAVGRDRQHHAEDQQQLAAVAVADRAEVEDRGGEPERVADRDQVRAPSATRRRLRRSTAARRSRPRGRGSRSRTSRCRHRPRFDSSQTTVEPDRGRLLARAGRLGALPRRARRPLRAQADADPRDVRSRSRPACWPPSRRRRGAVRCPRPRRPRGGHGVPDDAGADHRAVVGARRARSRSRCGRRSAAAISALGPLLAGAAARALLVGSVFLITLPLAVVALVMAVRFVPGARERDDRAGRQPRRHPVGRARRRADPRHQLRPGAEQATLALGLLAIVAAAAVGFLIRQRRAREPALRPARGGAADLLGRRLRRHHRLRLADGRDVHRPAVPPERARLLDARGRRGDPAGRGRAW